MSFKVIIAGGRNFTDYTNLKKYCNHLLQNKKDVEIVCGMARGADLLGKRYAEEMGYPVAKFPAEWDRFGKKAGYIRNEEMAEYADSLILFWDGKSRGSKHMLDLAEENELNIRIFRYYVT
jgi:hypothetical protein